MLEAPTTDYACAFSPDTIRSDQRRNRSAIAVSGEENSADVPAVPGRKLTSALRSFADRQAHLFREAAEVEVVAPGLDQAVLDTEYRHAACAHEVARRTRAVAEAMEGAAVGFTARRLGLATGSAPAFAELRVISNTTGDRSRQVWDLPRALSRLEQLGSQLLAALS